ncbi:retrotransposon protein, putative, ty1-copia subclass [Tanacetum coccineum]
MKNYVAQLERHGYVFPRDLSVGLIMNGLTSDFAGFVRNYNKHNMGMTIGELHALLVEYEKGLPKKAATPQVMAIQSGRIQKANKKSLNAKGKGKGKGKGKDKSNICKPKNPKPSAKGHPIKDDTCHHYKEVGHYKRNCHAYLAELIKKKKQVGTASSLDIFLTPPYTPQFSVVSERRNRTLLDMVRSMMNLTTLLLFFWYYALESATRILDMVPTKKVWGWEALMKRDTPDKLQQRSKSVGGVVELEEIQDEDTLPSKKTSEIPMEVEGFEPPREELIRVRRSVRTHQASECLCLNVEVEEHKMQSMKDNQVWLLVDLPPNCKTIRSKWLFKKKTDMDGNVHTYKARLIAKGFTQTNGVNYVETFSPVADIIAIRILIAIAVKVCNLQRFIYGLKQASKRWNKRFNEEIKRFGFTQNLDEPCVSQKTSGSNVTFLILYVDDIIIMGNHIPSLPSVKTYLGKCFSMKDLGEATFILGIKIYQDRSKRLIRLSQSAYMDKILKRYMMDNSKRGYIPMQERLESNKTQVLQHQEK